jgi:hypothetical protein
MFSMASRPLSVDEFAEITMGRHQWLDMDPLTFSKIVQVQLEDVENLSTRAKGKQREGTVTDAQFALQVYVDDLSTSNATLSDRMVAEDVAAALLRDNPAIKEAFRREQQIARDREFATELIGRRATPSNRRSIMQELQRNDSDPLKELWPTLLDSDSDESTITPESSNWAASRFIRDVRSKRRCVACAEERLIRDLATVPCIHEHEYCRECLSRMVRLAIEDESFFPPKCDGNIIPINMFRDFLPRNLVEQFESKATEYETKDRTYCHDHTCTTFIPPSAVDGLTGKCPSCFKTTCIVCKSAAHFGVCSSDEALHDLKETANKEQWQSCYMCNHVVQLERGCNHITYVST